MRSRHVLAFACLSTLAACAQQQPAPAIADVATAAPATPVATVPGQQGAAQQDAAPASGSAGQRAQVCQSPRLGRYRTGTSPVALMAVSNDGGWCGKGLTRNQGYPFTGGSVVDQPQHGEARIRHLANRTLVEYRPNPGYNGDDAFTVELTPGNGRYPFQVSVQP